MEIRDLDKNSIYMSNSNSFFNRGSSIERSYKADVQKIMDYDITDEQKQKIITKLHSLYAKQLSYDSRYIPVTVSGPARYNSKKQGALADKVLEIGSEIANFMESIDRQIRSSERVSKTTNDDRVNDCVEDIYHCIKIGFSHLVPKHLMQLALLSNDEFVKQYEILDKQLKFRKNSNVYKMYEQIKSGKAIVESGRPQFLFECDDYNVYEKNNRIFIRFLFKPKPQLIYALKRRGYFWNAYEGAWSTYISKYDEEWVKSIKDNYDKYI